MSYFKDHQLDQIETDGRAVAPITNKEIYELLARMDERVAKIEAVNTAAINKEKVEVEVGYVVGRRGDGQVCVWFYADRLKFKHLTIWQEQINSLPFTVDLSKSWPSSSPPNREEAESSDYWVPCKLETVWTADGLTEAGKVKYKFDRILNDDTEKAQAVPVARDREDELRTRIIRASSTGHLAAVLFDYHGREMFETAAKAKSFIEKVRDNRPLDNLVMMQAADIYATSLMYGNLKPMIAFGRAKAFYAGAVSVPAL